MPERRVTVGSKVGLHARPAALVAKAAAAPPVPITIRKTDGKPVRRLQRAQSDDARRHAR